MARFAFLSLALLSVQALIGGSLAAVCSQINSVVTNPNAIADMNSVIPGPRRSG